MEFYDVIKSRWSVRGYAAEPVGQEVLDRILAAVQRAPSAGNRQPVLFYVIRDEALRTSLKAAYGQDWFVSAPVVICACALPDQAWKRGDGKNYADVDVAIAMEHLVLAAAAEGLGTCWIAAFKPDVVRAALALPPNMEPVALTPLGVPADEPKATARKAMEELVRYR